MKKLTGNQSKLDLNKNGKLDSNDFKMLRSGNKMAKGGHVSKGEMVWKKLSSSDKIKFLYENFTPEITPRSQETLVGKPYNFLPKNVKIKMEAKYANVENYANGGGTGVSSETGYAVGTNSDLLMNQDYLAYKKGGEVGAKKKWSDYRLRQQNLMFEVIDWCSKNNMVIGSPSYMDKIEKVATTGDSDETNDMFNNMLDKLNKGNMVIESPTFMKKLEEAKKYAKGGSLADTPESFPSTDAMSYKKGGEVGPGKKRRFKKIPADGMRSDLNKGETPIKDYVRMYALHPRSYFVYPKDGDFENYVYVIEPFATIGFREKGGSTSGWCYSIGGL
jgi:hypothetical protein